MRDAIAPIVVDYWATLADLVKKHMGHGRLTYPLAQGDLASVFGQGHVIERLWYRLTAWDGDRDEGDVLVAELRAVTNPGAFVTDVRYALMAAVIDIAKVWRAYDGKQVTP